jgi:hypothetical protein
VSDGIVLNYNLSLNDKEEIKASQLEPLRAICFGIMDSDRPVAIFDREGTLAAIAGVVPVTDDIGAPWMLSTPAAKTEPRAFVRQARAWVNEQLDTYQLLQHKVYRHNHAHIKLLRLLGFTIEEPRSSTQLFLDFHQSCAPQP